MIEEVLGKRRKEWKDAFPDIPVYQKRLVNISPWELFILQAFVIEKTENDSDYFKIIKNTIRNMINDIEYQAEQEGNWNED